jgi:hypothetical protein
MKTKQNVKACESFSKAYSMGEKRAEAPMEKVCFTNN